MLSNILNRTIFWELVKVFLLSVGSLTGMFLMAVVVQEGSRLGIGFAQLLAIIPLFVPNLLPYTIPATTLFASCVVYGRLSHDNEVVAIKAAGVRLYVILKPAILLGLLTTGVTLGLYHTVIPRSQQLLYQSSLRDPEEVMYNMLKRERQFKHPTFPYVLYVKEVQGRRLVDVVFKKRMRIVDARSGESVMHGYDFVAWAREAQLHVDVQAGTLSLVADRFVIYDKNTQGATVSNHPLQFPLPDSLSGKEIKTRNTALTWDDLGPRVAELRAERDRIVTAWDASRKAAAELPDTHPSKPFYVFEDKSFKARFELNQRQTLNVQSEYHMRPALAFGCLCFALIGCPVGIWANRSDYLSTFVICFLPTVLIYYPLLLAGSNMGKDGKVPMWMGVWLANAVVGTLALALIWRLLRR